MCSNLISTTKIEHFICIWKRITTLIHKIVHKCLFINRPIFVLQFWFKNAYASIYPTIPISIPLILNYERNFILTLQVEILFPGIARIRGLRPYPSTNKPLKAGIHCMPFQLLVELTLNKRSMMVAPVERKYVYFGV